MNATMEDPVLGRMFLPEWNRSIFLPGNTVLSKPRHMSLFRFVVRSNGKATQAGFGFGLVPTDGLMKTWQETESLQERFKSADEFIDSFAERMKAAADPQYAKFCAKQYGWWHNERTDNGGKMAEKLLYGVAVPDHTAAVPTRMALCNLISFAAAHGDLSIGSATHDVTTNEFTNHGLSRTAALTPTNTDPSSLDGQYTIVIANTFTETTGPDTIYGAALFDAAVGTSNMYCEATGTAATTQTNDTYAGTWTNKG